MKRLISAAAILLLSSASGAAVAQSAAPQAAEEDSGVGEIVVTAQKREQSINSVGLTITAATGDQLAQRGINKTEDLVKLVPGFTYTPSPFATPVFTLRGVGLYDSGIAASPTVALYVDEAPLPYPLMALGETLDLERVEVLKGPQGTLFGQNSTGGAINYVAAKPTDHFTAGGQFSVERFGRIKAEAFASGPLSDTLKMRVAARTEQGGDWQYSVSRKDKLGGSRQILGRLLMDWQPSDRVKVMLNVNGWRDHSDIQAAQMYLLQPAGSSPPAKQAQAAALLGPSLYTGHNPRAADWTPTDPNRKRSRFYQSSLRGEFELSDDVKLVSITSYQDLKDERFHDADGAASINLQVNGFGRVKYFSQELRLTTAASAC